MNYMIQDTLTELWAQLMDRLNDTISPNQMEMYLRHLRPLRLEDSRLYAAVSSQRLKNSIEERFTGILNGVLTDLTGRQDMRLILEVVLTDPASTPAQPEKTYQFVQPVIPLIQEEEKTPEETFVSHLNASQTFQNFVIGNSNRFAHASAIAVAEKPLGEAYNPLFVYGESGIGKTHLMNAVGNALLKKNPQLKVLYLTCESFMNEMIGAIQNKTTEAFHRKYRSIDCLIIDDIQFLENKDSTQEEFFHTFNALHEAGKQIIITSDRKPQDLNGLEERLISRFASGLTADIKPPDLETRMAILRARAAENEVEIPNDVIQAIANSITGNVRLLQGAFNRLVAYADLMDSPIDMTTTRMVLDEIGTKNQEQVTIDKIIDLICSYYRVKRDDLLGKKRPKNIANPRQIAMYLCRSLTDASLPKIGDAFGKRDHTTVIHACEKVEKLTRMDTQFDKEIKLLMNELQKK